MAKMLWLEYTLKDLRQKLWSRGLKRPVGLAFYEYLKYVAHYGGLKDREANAARALLEIVKPVKGELYEDPDLHYFIRRGQQHPWPPTPSIEAEDIL